MRIFLTIFWGVDAFGAPVVTVESYDRLGRLVRQRREFGTQIPESFRTAYMDETGGYELSYAYDADGLRTEFASAVEDAQVWLGQCPESVELEGVTLVPVSTSVFSYDGNDSRLLQVSSDGSGSSLTYGAAGFVSSVASWGSADDSAVCFSLLCASADGRVLAAGGASVGVPEFGIPSTGANAGSVAGFDASVMHPLVWDENLFVPRVLGVAGSSLPSVGSLVPGAGSGAGLLDPYGWASLGVVAPAVPSAQGASATGGVPVLPDLLVGVSAASGVVLGSSGFEVLGARVVDSRVARFTAPNPLSAPVGAGWGADRFSLVGGNPVLLVDPWGLSPVSVEEYEKYRESCADRGVNGWLNRNSNWIQAGLTVVGIVASAVAFLSLGPVALIVAGVVAGASLAAASSISSNRDENGRVNWGRVGIDAAIGGAFGAIGGGIAGQGRNMMVALGRTKAVGALEQAVTSGWSKGAQVFATRASVHGIPEVVANFVGGFENLAHDAVNGKIGDKGQYSIREHVVSTVSGGIFGGLSNAAPRALAGSLAKKASPTLISTMEKTYQKTYDSARKVKNKITPYVQKINNEKITNVFDVTSEKVSNLIKKSKVDEPRPLIQSAFDTLTPAVLKTSQDLIETWGKKGEIGLTDIIWSGANGFKVGISGRSKYHEGSSVKDPRTIAQLGMSHDTSLSRITYVRNPEKNKARLDQKKQELDQIMMEIGRDNVFLKGKDELKDMASYIKDHREEVVNNSDKSFSEFIAGYQNSKGEK
ncbi:hypothetical protein [Rothia sp. P3C3.S176]|uniref:hypothetical protein n=1 Tax=Rothia sp. P3C3.S176 TaxID=2962204 RepID=UPI0020C8AAC4|nr:hypothetical protein [Rothia sp. P3C3.S176]MCP8996153.1 hypothetical protein [Rothia sp. P3C3.S176]